MTVCATPGPLASGARAALPARAFALPAQRKYPMYRMVAGQLVPSASHARNALARAAQWADRLTAREYETIIRRANSVLARCGKGSTMATKKKATKKPATKRAAKKKPTKKPATKRAAKKKPTKKKAKRNNPHNPAAAKKKPAKKKPAAKKKAHPPGIVADFNHGGRRIVLQEYPNGYLSAWLVPKVGPADNPNRLPLSTPGRTQDRAKKRHQAKDYVDHLNRAHAAADAGKVPPVFKAKPYRPKTGAGKSDGNGNGNGNGPSAATAARERAIRNSFRV